MAPALAHVFAAPSSSESPWLPVCFLAQRQTSCKANKTELHSRLSRVWLPDSKAVAAAGSGRLMSFKFTHIMHCKIALRP